VDSDANDDFYIGNCSNNGRTFDGAISWARISNNIRYTTSFTPPPRTSPPSTDANTMGLWKLDEGTGATIADSSANGNTGTLANGTWNTDRDMSTESSGERIYPWGYSFGTDAVNEGIYQD